MRIEGKVKKSFIKKEISVSNWEQREYLRTLECLFLFFFLPTLIVSDVLQLSDRWIIFTFIGAHLIYVYHKKMIKFLKRIKLNDYLLFLGLVSVASIAAYSISTPQNRLFYFFILVTYPLISVPLQEAFFRIYFFKRYKFMPLIFKRTLNVIGFAYFHLIYGNLEAFMFTLVGGIIFTEYYIRSKSFKSVWILHALLGSGVFLLGFTDSFTDIFK